MPKIAFIIITCQNRKVKHLCDFTDGFILFGARYFGVFSAFLSKPKSVASIRKVDSAQHIKWLLTKKSHSCEWLGKDKEYEYSQIKL